MDYGILSLPAGRRRWRHREVVSGTGAAWAAFDGRAATCVPPSMNMPSRKFSISRQNGIFHRDA
jgi:hypothetical protein